MPSMIFTMPELSDLTLPSSEWSKLSEGMKIFGDTLISGYKPDDPVATIAAAMNAAINQGGATAYFHNGTTFVKIVQIDHMGVNIRLIYGAGPSDFYSLRVEPDGPHDNMVIAAPKGDIKTYRDAYVHSIQGLGNDEAQDFFSAAVLIGRCR